LPSLRALNSIAESLLQDRIIADSFDNSTRLGFVERIYSKEVLDRLSLILAQEETDFATLSEIDLTSRLIAATCTEEQHQNLVTRVGILDLLSSKLASVLVHRFFTTIPRNEDGLVAILEAIGTIIDGSTYRTARFIYSPSILALGPVAKTNTNADSSSYPYAKPDTTTFSDSNDVFGLPKLQGYPFKNPHVPSKVFPALGGLSSTASDSTKLIPTDNFLNPIAKTSKNDDFETPIFGWLIAVARQVSKKDQRRERLSAIWLLTLLKRYAEAFPADENTRSRERTLAFLTVPLIVQMIDEASQYEFRHGANADANVSHETKCISERAPAVLAALVEDSPLLQKSVHETGIIKKLCQMLKKTFDPIPAQGKPFWNPSLATAAPTDRSVDPASSSLGRPRYSPEVVHALKCRESLFLALAAIADKEDIYRKLIIEGGGVQCITDSLSPYSSDTWSKDPITLTAKVADGNPVSVVISACKAAKAMSRSVSMLRTSLIDHGIAKPIAALLDHPVLQVRVAATEVICNLVLHFSPMREVVKLHLHEYDLIS
jgi:armadillo repeat-containing protein 8